MFTFKNKEINHKFSRRKFLSIIGFAAIGTTAFGLNEIKKFKEKNKSVKWQGVSLGARSKIEIHHHSEKLANDVLGSIVNDLAKYEKIFSLYKKDSQLTLLNNNSIIKEADVSLLDLLKKSKEISKLTEGAFDVTVQPLWQFYSQHFITNKNQFSPNSKDIELVKKLVDWKKIKIKNNIISFENKSMKATLNGIAQGWITDQITNKLKASGINNVLVDLGETYALGKYNNKRPWVIGLEGPDGIADKIQLVNKAVATSGGYGTIFDNSAKFHHVFDPKSGYSANRHKAISIVSDHAWIADALSTAALSMEKDKIAFVAKELNSSAYCIEKNKLIKI